MLEDYKVSRRLGKALTLPTAPAYSFGGRHERNPGDPGPGPGAYGTGPTNAKGIGFGTSPRGATFFGTATPAGAAYDPKEKTVSPSKPAYSFGGKHKPAKPTAGPGPGAYEPSPSANLVKPSPNAFSIATRPDGRDAERSPGPAEYSPSFRPTEPLAASLKSRHANLPSQWEVLVTPGPGEYDGRQAWRPRSEGKTFGVSRGSRSLANGVPGPGEYGSPPIDPYRPRRASWTIGRAMRDSGPLPRRGLPGPGPGAYDHQPLSVLHEGGHSAASDHRSPPAYTFGGRPGYSGGPPSPGPGEYGAPSPKDPGAVSKPAFTLRPQTKRREKEKTPGPGAYRAGDADALVRRSAPEWSVGQRNVEHGAEASPGPGAYDPREGDGRIAVSVKLPHPSPRPDHLDNPAPHDYANKDFRAFGASDGGGGGAPGAGAGSGGLRGFTMRPRYPESRRETVPGPHYAMGVSTLGVAPMAMVDKSKLDAMVVL